MSYMHIPGLAAGTLYTAFRVPQSTITGHYHPYSTDEDTEAQSGLVTCSNPTVKKGKKLVLKTLGWFLA